MDMSTRKQSLATYNRKQARAIDMQKYMLTLSGRIASTKEQLRRTEAYLADQQEKLVEAYIAHYTKDAEKLIMAIDAPIAQVEVRYCQDSSQPAVEVLITLPEDAQHRALFVYTEAVRALDVKPWKPPIYVRVQ